MLPVQRNRPHLEHGVSGLWVISLHLSPCEVGHFANSLVSASRSCKWSRREMVTFGVLATAARQVAYAPPQGRYPRWSASHGWGDGRSDDRDASSLATQPGRGAVVALTIPPGQPVPRPGTIVSSSRPCHRPSASHSRSPTSSRTAAMCEQSRRPQEQSQDVQIRRTSNTPSYARTVAARSNRG